MHISSISTAYGGGEAHRLLHLLLPRQAGATGQDLPGPAPAADSSAAPTPPAGGGPSGAQFASATLASLLATQEGPPTSADIAAKVISAADTDGDGSLSLDEVSAALRAQAVAVDEISVERGRLDEVFRRITTQEAA